MTKTLEINTKKKVLVSLVSLSRVYSTPESLKKEFERTLSAFKSRWSIGEDTTVKSTKLWEKYWENTTSNASLIFPDILKAINIDRERAISLIETDISLEPISKVAKRFKELLSPEILIFTNKIGKLYVKFNGRIMNESTFTSIVKNRFPNMPFHKIEEIIETTGMSFRDKLRGGGS